MRIPWQARENGGTCADCGPGPGAVIGPGQGQSGVTWPWRGRRRSRAPGSAGCGSSACSRRGGTGSSLTRTAGPPGPRTRKRRGRATHYEGVAVCVARRSKARASFMFAGCSWWRSLAVDGCWGISGARARNAWARFSVERRRRTTFRWGRTYPKLARIARAL